jgi:hypothetical protein
MISRYRQIYACIWSDKALSISYLIFKEREEKEKKKKEISYLIFKEREEKEKKKKEISYLASFFFFFKR